MIMNGKGVKPDEVGGIKVVEHVKYLGVIVTDKRMSFNKHKMEQAKRMANMTYSVIARSPTKMLMGKTYWKSVVFARVDDRCSSDVLGQE
jgi:hypothetical protein